MVTTAGVAAGSGLVICFIGAIVSHLRVGDFKGIGAAAFMFGLSVASVVLRIATIEARDSQIVDQPRSS